MPRKNQVYTKICPECNKVFRTDKCNKRYCDDCRKRNRVSFERKIAEECKKQKMFHRVLPNVIPVREFTAIIERYNHKHKTHYSYGQFVLMLYKGIITKRDLKECVGVDVKL